VPAKTRSSGGDGGLSTQRVVAEAIRLADAEGVEGLSMRRLAGVLGAGAMSLYHYVANKEQLLDGMIDVVFSEIELDAGDPDWRSAMRGRAMSAREVLLRHPWAIPLMESRTAPGPSNLRHREAVTACLRRGGFSVSMATHANWLLDSYVYGFALQEVALLAPGGEELSQVTEQVFLPQLPAEQFPYLNESAAALVSGEYDPAGEFEFGLELVLAALDPLRD